MFVTINRPKVLNALNGQVIDELTTAFDRFALTRRCAPS